MASAEELFIFAGAGASFARPANLPLFFEVRDHILAEFGLDAYAEAAGYASLTTERRVAEGLVPEPFMLALQRAGVALAPWLSDVFAIHHPNAVHWVIAQLALAGARVWTVNFDEGIEIAASSPLRVVAWPHSPEPPADLLKPHGTTGGELIVTAEQVLKGLEPPWKERLRQDLIGRRIVIFIGYRGRDLDFQPVWNDALSSAERVLWFDRPPTDDRSRGERLHKQRLLRDVDAAGRLEFPDPAIPPSPGLPPNPSWDFVSWVEAQGLATAPAELRDQIYAERESTTLPSIGDTSALTGAAVQEVLGDISGARATYMQVTLKGPDRGSALRCLAQLTANHGARPTAALLACADLLPPIGSLASRRSDARRKRLSILFNIGRHSTVVRKTRHLPDNAVSTLRILRAGSLRMTSDLDEAAAVADESFRAAVVERHPVRAANAAFQHAFALMWAGRLDEAEQALAEELRPHAEIAASRWVAWADFLEAALHVHRRRAVDALTVLDAGTTRFQAEALVDGVVSCDLVRLTALRQAGDRDGFYRAHSALQGLLSDPHGTYYAKRNRFTHEALRLEQGEFARCQAEQPVEAQRAFEFTATSRYQIHASLAHLGLAALAVESGRVDAADRHALAAATMGHKIRARLLVERADSLAADAHSEVGTRPSEVFFP